MLSWSPPKFLGGRTDTVYRITCSTCSSGVTYNPNTERFNDTRITISGLSPVSHYHFKVYAENGVTNLAGDPEHVELDINTQDMVQYSVPSMIRNVRAVSSKATEISLMWDAPDDPFSDLETFEIRFYIKGKEANATTIKTGRETKYKFENLKQKTEYAFQIRAKTVSGWGEYSTPVIKRTGQLMTLVSGEDDYSRQGLLITIIAVAVALVLVFLCIAAALFFRG